MKMSGSSGFSIGRLNGAWIYETPLRFLEMIELLGQWDGRETQGR